ncbi:MAG: N-acetyltransferase [Streptomyces sp.]|nr:N-acetyltransferase [Streptomyces sp.]NUS16475.1 N-acetyltransferase [Streptomyces sp.]
MNNSGETPVSSESLVGDEFVPADFTVPGQFDDGEFHLVPLGPEHNERDYDAWSTSMEHIRRTPGFEKYSWPILMTIEENRRDLVQHAVDFSNRAGFTYSVISDQDEVIGCVYIYPAERAGHAVVRSWVRKECAHLDAPLYEAVGSWLRTAWPFAGFSYAPRTKQYEFAD